MRPNSFKKQPRTFSEAATTIFQEEKRVIEFQEFEKENQQAAHKNSQYPARLFAPSKLRHPQKPRIVVPEDLKVTHMSKPASGTLNEPGKMVAAKSGLNHSILARGWHSFKSILSYKLDRLGGELLLVDPCYTSQKCSSCGHTEKENRLSQARFACMQCGFRENADAAKNVLAAGHAVLSLQPEVALAA